MRRRSRRRLQSTILYLLIPLSVGLMLVPRTHSQWARSFVLTVTHPLKSGIGSVVTVLFDLPGTLGEIGRLRKENSELHMKVIRLESKLAYSEKILRADLDDLRKQVKELTVILPKTGYALRRAAIISKNVSVSRKRAHTITIEAGSDAGIRTGDLAVVGYSVVGQVITVSNEVSTVRLITDPAFRIETVTKPGNYDKGYLSGGSDGMCLLNLVKARAPVKKDDFVVTSSYGGKYPPGLLLGTVLKIEASDASRLSKVTVTPAVNINHVSQVIVIRRLSRPIMKRWK